MVVLLHGFPQFWWAWRHQLAPLAAAGYRAVAVDLRGYGDSDKTPRGYDPLTLAADVAGVIRSLGSRDAVVVGQGWGGYVAWTVAAGHPDVVRALCSVAAPHPLEMLRPSSLLTARTPLLHLAAMQVPWLPERRIMRGPYIAGHLRAWSSAGNSFPTDDEVASYREALSRWPAPHCALEYHRWLLRSRLRADGRAFGRMMRQPVPAPVLAVVGRDDPVVSTSLVARSQSRVAGPFEAVVVDGSGHFVPEEQPQAMTDTLLTWLATLPAPG